MGTPISEILPHLEAQLIELNLRLKVLKLADHAFDSPLQIRIDQWVTSRTIDELEAKMDELYTELES